MTMSRLSGGSFPMQLSELKGIGPKRLALLKQLHIETPEDLLRFCPKEYLDDTQCSEIRSLSHGEKATVRVQVLSDPTIFYHQHKYIVSVRVSDGSGKATLRWMNQPYRMQQLHTGETLFATGTVNKKRGVVLYNPQISREARGIVPVYPSVKGLPQQTIRDAIAVVFSETAICEHLPFTWLDRYRLIGLREAIEWIHFPKTTEQLFAAKRRLSFEDAFLYFTAMQSAKDSRRLLNGFSFRTEHALSAFLKLLPFQPTDAQMRTMHEIEADLSKPVAMNRLVQGDVGSGKTLVAEFALWVAVQNHKQCTFLAPTEILAEQHFLSLSRIFPNACLYTGSLSNAEKKSVLQRMESGEADLVIGTHALFSDAVRFRDLGLVVTDEQHRFGVLQRAKIEEKGIRPDVLVMSATPIPRTLALLIYADLDLSVINEMPKGRKPVKTHYVPGARRKDLYLHLAKNAQNGERSYVVCPLIEPTEGFDGLSLIELEQEMKELLPNTAIGVLHGQMKEEEKRSAMEAFRKGDTSVLLATTVVEVGVDVPEATAMVIEGADHFGLATLHQLRGRVGRGELQSHCYLLAQKPGDTAKERIKTMLASSDGFVIAQKDLELRGMGDLFGVRQSGAGELGDLLSGCTVEILELAANAAKEIHELPDILHNALKEEAEKRFRQFAHIARN